MNLGIWLLYLLFPAALLGFALLMYFREEDR